ncbi:hypothetical protein CBM2605_A60594 [Cupriavidus neocaledonicus]|uniref:Uncharacterized protein n=1 Tax=Cupriavidus neocaledonicus TaxID=1040979 RepID=A0ABY1V4D9_9BURK|nr:hypothetical protein CBM2605_A60594 [Cupriavidus neocaledonicus]
MRQVFPIAELFSERSACGVCRVRGLRSGGRGGGMKNEDRCQIAPGRAKDDKIGEDRYNSALFVIR